MPARLSDVNACQARTYVNYFLGETPPLCYFVCSRVWHYVVLLKIFVFLIKEMKMETKEKAVVGENVVLVMDPDFVRVNPSYSELDRIALRVKVASDGCIVEPFCMLKGTKILLSRHEEYKVAQEFGLFYQVKEVEYADKAEALAKVAEANIAIPTLSTFQRIEIALPLGEFWKMKAKENQGKRIDKCKDELAKLENIDTLGIIAMKARTSRTTVSKVKKIIEDASESTISKCRQGQISIDAAHQTVCEPTKEDKKLAEAQKEATKANKKAKEISSLAKYTVKGFSSIKDKIDEHVLKFFVLRWNEENSNNRIEMSEIQNAIKDFKE